MREFSLWTLRVLIASALILSAGCKRRGEPSAPNEKLPPPEPAGLIAELPSDISTLRFPTAQTNLLGTNLAAVFMPTASGNPESGLYGSVRSGLLGNKVMPRFHEGIDIAPLMRDRNGRPLDEVFAAANGRVAMIHRTAGNSDYGIYVVLEHHDPIGTFYTLYAHLASVDSGLREGEIVAAGTRLGIMGNTALSPIPISRAHLHFEIGLIANSRFLSWPGLPKKNMPGGLYNGLNLYGLDPIPIFRDALETGGEMSLRDHIRRVPVAFEIIAYAPTLPDYFRRYPALWAGPPDHEGPVVIAAQEGGVVLSGRPATPEESALLRKAGARVLRVNEKVLGRNGRRIVIRRGDGWVLGPNGESWLSLLLH
ncbi:MAG: M23 family metallopeptidase [Kiritimatiellae bacterium]|nr:M23 family metallopeptidase [Kiritimatiellia bacterium]MDW8458521.1 M23 family metallopeptidase [Verrucomicrobiota bacterium]